MVEQILQSAYAPDGPGAALIVTRYGETLLRKAIGMANLELSVPLEPDMIFRIGSLTKQFTAVAILMLIKQGKLRLEDTISNFIPDYSTQGQTMTIEHLLTHTSGIQDYIEIPEIGNGLGIPADFWFLQPFTAIGKKRVLLVFTQFHERRETKPDPDRIGSQSPY